MNIKPALVQIPAWHRIDNDPSSEPMLVSFTDTYMSLPSSMWYTCIPRIMHYGCCVCALLCLTPFKFTCILRDRHWKKYDCLMDTSCEAIYTCQYDQTHSKTVAYIHVFGIILHRTRSQYLFTDCQLQSSCWYHKISHPCPSIVSNS